MHISVLAARDQVAQERIQAAGEALGRRAAVGEQLGALRALQGRDRAVLAMRRAELVADLLEALEEALAEKEVARAQQSSRLAPEALREALLGIKGIGEAKADEILAALGPRLSGE
jgi:3-methyladenine DNA glycosylase/8-oxoguanine DNA glycosylase